MRLAGQKHPHHELQGPPSPQVLEVQHNKCGKCRGNIYRGTLWHRHLDEEIITRYCVLNESIAFLSRDGPMIHARGALLSVPIRKPTWLELSNESSFVGRVKRPTDLRSWALSAVIDHKSAGRQPSRTNA